VTLGRLREKLWVCNELSSRVMENIPQGSRVCNYVQNQLKWQGSLCFYVTNVPVPFPTLHVSTEVFIKIQQSTTIMQYITVCYTIL